MVNFRPYRFCYNVAVTTVAIANFGMWVIIPMFLVMIDVTRKNE